MLGNPAYSGTLVVGKWSRGKFCRLNDTGLVVYENAHDAIVSPEVFDAVQTTLASRKKTHQRSDAGKYLLSGLLRCVHCGNRMYGVDRKRANRPNRQVFYHCANAPEHPKYDQSCPHPAVRQDRLEAFVIDKIRSHLIKTNAAERIQEAITRAKNRETIQSPNDDRKLAALRAKIERATENLALADRDNFEGISRLIAQWRDEESMLLERMEKLSCELDPLPEAIDVIERLSRKPAITGRLCHHTDQPISRSTRRPLWIQKKTAAIMIGTRNCRGLKANPPRLMASDTCPPPGVNGGTKAT